MPHHVKVFALSTCIHCRNTKEFLDQCGVSYDCVHVDELTGDERKACIEEVRRYNPAVSFPTVVIDGDTVVVGFRKDRLRELLGGA
ncbi:glutaredoxin-like protein NrdH [Desulfobaculum xiamenense]|uniref:Glutaredoxin-like protein NrdH n=1 Tax=Desulfobaculum xiamenense TaxID=995050 RepID=A0A846QQ16_9BACT|nr:glutaredoxin family protein [Desulfobaculum xiamenense]NJB68423.1 glutaredoxin-like protein NrdH [Desulfobaculum xiamenense]